MPFEMDRRRSYNRRLHRRIIAPIHIDGLNRASSLRPWTKT
jgi:hypothetical protein